MSIGPPPKWDTRPAENEDFFRTRSLERTRASVRRRAAGINVINQENRFSRQFVPELGRHGKGSANNAIALAGIGAAQQCRRSGAQQDIEMKRQAARPCKVLGNERGLVETAPEYPPAMRRHRDQKSRPLGYPVHEKPGNQPCQPDPPAMLELESDISRQIAIDGNRVGPVMVGSLLEAGCADCDIGREGRPASLATVPGQQVQRLPAGRAQLQVVAHDLAAAGTSWRKRERNDIPEHITHKMPCCVASAVAQGPAMTPPEIFNRSARRQLRSRMLRYPAEDRWIVTRMAEDLLDRLDAVRVPLKKALLIGGDHAGLSSALAERGISCVSADPGFAMPSAAGGVVCDEDRLPFADGSFDLVMAIGTLDTVSDLPGALVLIRRVLTEGGLFLGAMMGAGSLPFLRSCLQQQEDGQPIVSRFHPQIDVRGAGDLLARAQFALPVAESEQLSARYRTLDRLIADLRANGLTNCLAQRRPLRKTAFDRIAARFSDPVTEQFAIVTLTGWANPPG